MKNLKEAIELAAQLPHITRALDHIASASGIRNDQLRFTFTEVHGMRWHDYVPVHKENILADYVAELQAPQFGAVNTTYWHFTDRGGRFIVADEKSTIIAECFGNSPQDRANMTLCAAAPDMLAVLKKTSLDLHVADERGPCLCSQCEFRSRAQIAIAKAEGRA